VGAGREHRLRRRDGLGQLTIAEGLHVRGCRLELLPAGETVGTRCLYIADRHVIVAAAQTYRST
jgi:hypothetical protein